MFTWLARKLAADYIVLNAPEASKASSAEESSVEVVSSKLASQLNAQVLSLYGEFLSEDGHRVDYAGMAKSDAFAAYVAHAASLHSVDATQLPQNERLAFFINLYNMLEIHARIHARDLDAAALKKTKDRCAYDVGGHLLSLSDIEHGVLRANRRPPYTPANRFGSDDPRLALCVQQVDPRIHFALVCGAKSCPPVRIFNPANLERALDAATAWFCNDDANVQIDAKSATIRLSMIFRWYSGDFGTPDTDFKNVPTLQFILRHMRDTTNEEASKKQTLELMLKSGSFSVEWLPYDWSVNAKE